MSDMAAQGPSYELGYAQDELRKLRAELREAKEALSHISTQEDEIAALKERLAFMERALGQAVKLAGNIRASDIGGFSFTWPQINVNGGAAPFVFSNKEAPELAVYLRTQGGKS